MHKDCTYYGDNKDGKKFIKIIESIKLIIYKVSTADSL